MKLLPNKYALSTVLLSCTLLFTFNASAKEVTLEQSLATTLQAQGEKAAQDLSAQVSNSIKLELQRFSMRYNTVKTQEVAVISTQNKLKQKKQHTADD
tara:strand:+ start:3395 stop:3688 length:294 start_codon:yes stop_codon:yes gene_type:complete